MGVEPFLVSSSVDGAIAQRLVREICPECKIKITDEKIDLGETIAGIDPTKPFYRATICGLQQHRI